MHWVMAYASCSENVGCQLADIGDATPLCIAQFGEAIPAPDRRPAGQQVATTNRHKRTCSLAVLGGEPS